VTGAWTFASIDHVQLAMPEGGEEDAERFYRDVLGFVVVPKPPAMAARGGRWFERGSVKIHLGVEPDFRPARKAHPAIVVTNFDALLGRLREAGVAFKAADDGPGVRRGHFDDVFGNRIEIIDPEPASSPGM
jgi:catechol 2,3-dioxygenase-like lactoylglutathione lyase family enzyme